ncbi:MULTISPECIES: hypothetical protein [Kitasatospora]|nr:hypothetical protein [Kitasatospora sp. GP30]MDH6142445.1 hypothetical protein [Kitasatospora sp. GP30]
MRTTLLRLLRHPATRCLVACLAAAVLRAAAAADDRPAPSR